MSEATQRTHKFNATAKVLEGNLRLPLIHTVQPQAHTQLPEEGGYRSIRTGQFNLEGVLSYGAAYSQTAGNAGVKPGQGWSTVSTTVVEDLNILEVLTADRVVGQVITEHPLEGYVPHISFLGTRFENLRLAGHPVDLDLDLDLLGDKPENDGAYTKHPDVQSRVRSQYDRIRGAQGLSVELAERYDNLTKGIENADVLEASLVNQAAGPYPGKSFGHVIHIPYFGTITLAKLTLTHSNPHPESGTPRTTLVELKMVDLKLGCAIDGDLSFVVMRNNGDGEP